MRMLAALLIVAVYLNVAVAKEPATKDSGPSLITVSESKSKDKLKQAKPKQAKPKQAKPKQAKPKQAATLILKNYDVADLIEQNDRTVTEFIEVSDSNNEESLYEEIESLIKSSIVAKDWDDGSHTNAPFVQLYIPTHSLLVLQTEANHEKLVNLLSILRHPIKVEHQTVSAHKGIVIPSKQTKLVTFQPFETMFAGSGGSCPVFK